MVSSVALNTTIQNRTKQPRLSSEHIAPTHSIRNKTETLRFLFALNGLDASKTAILYAIGKQLMGATKNVKAQEFLDTYKCQEAQIPSVPRGEFDLLGTCCQFLSSKLENLEKGSFYTGPSIAQDLVGDLTFDNGETILDPSCGSGALLIQSGASPEQIVGVDNDPIAIMMAKFNYFLKFPDAGAPKLYASDFFEWHSVNHGKRFNYVVGNPPYGANVNLTHSRSKCVTTGESFAHFIECGFELLADRGVLRVLVPEALLNVKRHQDIRDYILDSTNLLLIKGYKAAFAGVMSDIYRIDLDKGTTTSVRFESSVTSVIPKNLFKTLKNHIFCNLTDTDVHIVEKVRRLSDHDLSNSTFGLGVVTGNNKKKLLQSKNRSAERIYTGKEVAKYVMLPAQNYLVFKREQLQQVAPDNLYRAPEKLIYKTISKRLKVAIDRSGSLTTNSANIIIPNVPGHTIETVAALLNSDLYSFLNMKMFGGVNKVARENLEHLPMPFISAKQVETMETLVRAYDGNDDSALQEYVHVQIFGLTSAEVAHVRDHVRPGSGATLIGRSTIVTEQAGENAYSELVPLETRASRMRRASHQLELL